ncbi:MAG: hypothetical protein HY830_04440 [Actinobacteria bacterium]|nr:hypothetical protein [Actinomycetota bacterium]
MRVSVGDAASAVRARSAAAVCALAAVLTVLAVLPALTPGAAAPGSFALAVLAFALAALTRTGVQRLQPAHTRGPARAPGGATPPSRPGTATDPVHHPLRPRAPGQA